MRNVNFNCLKCGKDFLSKKVCKSRIPKYCSKNCYALSLRKDRKCPICEGHVTWNNKIYCSKKCESKFRTGKSFSEEHKKKLSDLKIGKKIPHLHTKEICKKISESLKGKPQPWMRGSNHPNYKDGGAKTSERLKAMGRVEYKVWRRSVFERDDFTCVTCKARGRIIHADHIQPWSLFPELRYEITNGRTLCVKCHRQTSTWGGVRRKK